MSKVKVYPHPEAKARERNRFLKMSRESRDRHLSYLYWTDRPLMGYLSEVDHEDIQRRPRAAANREITAARKRWEKKISLPST